MDIEEIKSANKIIGTKQTLRSVEKGLVSSVVIARDAQKTVINPLLELCSKRGIPINYVDSMKELGSICGVQVSAATVGILA